MSIKRTPAPAPLRKQDRRHSVADAVQHPLCSPPSMAIDLYMEALLRVQGRRNEFIRSSVAKYAQDDPMRFKDSTSEQIEAEIKAVEAEAKRVALVLFPNPNKADYTPPE